MKFESDHPPLTLDYRSALAYANIAKSLFDELERRGSLTPRRIGGSGAKRYQREEVERVVRSLFHAPELDIDDEFTVLRR